MAKKIKTAVILVLLAAVLVIGGSIVSKQLQLKQCLDAYTALFEADCVHFTGQQQLGNTSTGCEFYMTADDWLAISTASDGSISVAGRNYISAISYVPPADAPSREDIRVQAYCPWLDIAPEELSLSDPHKVRVGSETWISCQTELGLLTINRGPIEVNAPSATLVFCFSQDGTLLRLGILEYDNGSLLRQGSYEFHSFDPESVGLGIEENEPVDIIDLE